MSMSVEPSGLVSITKYMELVGIKPGSRRIVMRALEADRIPGARKEDGLWWIPADAPILPPRPGRAVVNAVPESVVEYVPTPYQMLADANLVLELPEAAVLLRTTPAQVATLLHAGRLDGWVQTMEPSGKRRTVVTRASVQAIAGTP